MIPETQRKLINGDTLIVTRVNDVFEPCKTGEYYSARVSRDSSNLGFDWDSGKIGSSETLQDVADSLEVMLNDNIRS